MSEQNKQKLSMRTFALAVGGLILTAVLVGWLVPPRSAPVEAPREDLAQIDAQALETWLLAVESLAAQQEDVALRIRSRRLTDFLRELDTRRKEYEGRVDLAGMGYDRFVAVTRAIHYARSRLSIEHEVRQRFRELARAQRALQVDQARGQEALPVVEPPRAEPLPTASAEQRTSVTVYQRFAPRIERALGSLSLG